MFSIDLKANLTLSYREVQVDCVPSSPSKSLVYFSLPSPGDYTMALKFGGQPVPGGFCTLTVSDPRAYFAQLHSIYYHAFPYCKFSLDNDVILVHQKLGQKLIALEDFINLHN